MLSKSLPTTHNFRVLVRTDGTKVVNLNLEVLVKHAIEHEKINIEDVKECFLLNELSREVI